MTQDDWSSRLCGEHVVQPAWKHLRCVPHRFSWSGRVLPPAISPHTGDVLLCILHISRNNEDVDYGRGLLQTGIDCGTRNPMTDFFVRFQATRDLTEAELIGVLQGLALLREEQSIRGWRLAHEFRSPPRVSLQLEAETDSDAAAKGGILFVEALAAANLEDERDVFRLGETVSRA